MSSKDENIEQMKTNHFSTIGHDDQSEIRAIVTTFVLIEIEALKVKRKLPCNSNTLTITI